MDLGRYSRKNGACTPKASLVEMAGMNFQTLSGGIGGNEFLHRL